MGKYGNEKNPYLKTFRAMSLFFEILEPKIVGNEAKGRISKRVLQETKRAKFSEKRTFLTS